MYEFLHEWIKFRLQLNDFEINLDNANNFIFKQKGSCCLPVESLLFRYKLLVCLVLRMIRVHDCSRQCLCVWICTWFARMKWWLFSILDSERMEAADFCMTMPYQWLQNAVLLNSSMSWQNVWHTLMIHCQRRSVEALAISPWCRCREIVMSPPSI